MIEVLSAEFGGKGPVLEVGVGYLGILAALRGSLGGDVTALFLSARNGWCFGSGNHTTLIGGFLALARAVKQQPADQRHKNHRAENESITPVQDGFGI